MQQISKIVAWSGGSSRDLMPTGPEFESPQVYFCLPFTIERVRFRNKRSSSSFLGFLQMFCAAANDFIYIFLICFDVSTTIYTLYKQINNILNDLEL